MRTSPSSKRGKSLILASWWAALSADGAIMVANGAWPYNVVVGYGQHSTQPGDERGRRKRSLSFVIQRWKGEWRSKDIDCC